jgi:predicted N-acetyltransferase YhbS
MEILIQPTTLTHFPITENITREAFWNIYRPGCVEHFILHNLRNSNSYVQELDLIAVVENVIVGHIISTKAKVVDTQNKEYEVLCTGPLSVLPDFQKKGIGSMLMNHSIKTAKELGFSGIILYGNPDYYHRFGFRNAQEVGITTKEGKNFEPFMALELQEKGLENVTGRFIEDAAFEVQPDEVIEFDKDFPYKEKLVTDTQFEH